MRVVFAFVDIDAGAFIVAPLESRIAVTRVGTRRVDALGVDRADSAREARALVNVFAVSEGVHAEPDGAIARVAARYVVARLVLPAFVSVGGALVDVETPVPLRIWLVSWVAAEQALAMVGARGVDAPMVAATQAAVVRALVDIYAVAETVACVSRPTVYGLAASVLQSAAPGGASAPHAAKRTFRVLALEVRAAVVNSQGTLVIVFTLAGGGVDGVAGSTARDPDAGE